MVFSFQVYLFILKLKLLLAGYTVNAPMTFSSASWRDCQFYCCNHSLFHKVYSTNCQNFKWWWMTSPFKLGFYVKNLTFWFHIWADTNRRDNIKHNQSTFFESCESHVMITNTGAFLLNATKRKAEEQKCIVQCRRFKKLWIIFSYTFLFSF